MCGGMSADLGFVKNVMYEVIYYLSSHTLVASVVQQSQL